MAGQEFYAVIIICIIVLAAIVCGLGIRIYRRATVPGNPTSIQQEWQPMDSMFSPSVPTPDTHEINDRTIGWQRKHPPNTTTWVDASQIALVAERGVAAWTFVEDEFTEDAEEECNVAVIDRTTIVFADGQGCILTNLPIPLQDFVYWEVKILQLTDQDHLAIGLATKPYPTWCLPGCYRHSVAYHSHTGAVHASNPKTGRPYGPCIQQGDVVGVGFLSQFACVFFTHNGQNLGKALIGFKFPVYPAIGARGTCQVSVNFGQQDFLYAAANLREAAFAPRQDALPPPPAYGGHIRDTILFDASQASHDTPQLTYSEATTSPSSAAIESSSHLSSSPPRYS